MDRHRYFYRAGRFFRHDPRRGYSVVRAPVGAVIAERPARFPNRPFRRNSIQPLPEYVELPHGSHGRPMNRFTAGIARRPRE
ncbi:MAG: hypothetical protein ACLFQQ_12440 [Desulfococcaceae bacterium]